MIGTEFLELLEHRPTLAKSRPAAQGLVADFAVVRNEPGSRAKVRAGAYIVLRACVGAGGAKLCVGVVRVELDEAPEGPVDAVLVWNSVTTDTENENFPVRTTVTGSFPAAFSLSIHAPPPEESLNDLTEVGLVDTRVGIATIEAALNEESAGEGSGLGVDEHHVMYDIGDMDREVFRRAAVEGIHFTVFDNCPIVEQLENETRVLGRSWVACTPIRSARANLGMLFNDAGLSGAPLDEGKQSRAAILCSLLGTVLELTLVGPKRVPRKPTGTNPMIVDAVAWLAKDPSLTGTTIASKLDISLSRLARVFKQETGASLVEYRNRLRLERFQMLVDSGGENLLEAALA